MSSDGDNGFLFSSRCILLLHPMHREYFQIQRQAKMVSTGGQCCVCWPTGDKCGGTGGELKENV